LQKKLSTPISSIKDRSEKYIIPFTKIGGGGLIWSIMIFGFSSVELSGGSVISLSPTLGVNTLKRFAVTNNFFLFLFTFKFGERPRELWLEEVDKFLLLVFVVQPSFEESKSNAESLLLVDLPERAACIVVLV